MGIMRTPKLFNKYTYIYNQMDLWHLNRRSLLYKYHNVLLPRIIYTDTDQQWGQQKNQCNCHRFPHSQNQLGDRYILQRMKTTRWHDVCLYKYIYSFPPNGTKTRLKKARLPNSTPSILHSRENNAGSDGHTMSSERRMVTIRLFKLKDDIR